MDYWKECISEALEEAGIVATDEQIETITSWVEGAHENYSMAHGYDCIPNPIESQAQQELDNMKREKERHERWVITTKPCSSCTTTGWVVDGWGRDVVCGWCGGKGRV